MFFIKKGEKMDRIDKINFIISNFVRITLLIAIPFSIYEKNWMALFVSLLTLFLISLPDLFSKRYRINLIAEFQIVIVLFIYAGLFLGEVKEYYIRFWWYDSVLHAFSGVALGFAGFLILYTLYKTGKFKAGLGLIALFSFCFAVAMGTLWEILEFGIDTFFDANMQRSRNLMGDTRMGLIDTMWDIILNTIGASIASFSGYLYLKKVDVPIVKRLVERFEKKNPKLFR